MDPISAFNLSNVHIMSVGVFFIWESIDSGPQVLLLDGWRLRAARISDRVTKALTCTRLARLNKDVRGQEQTSLWSDFAFRIRAFGMKELKLVCEAEAVESRNSSSSSSSSFNQYTRCPQTRSALFSKALFLVFKKKKKI